MQLRLVVFMFCMCMLRIVCMDDHLLFLAVALNFAASSAALIVHGAQFYINLVRGCPARCRHVSNNGCDSMRPYACYQ